MEEDNVYCIYADISILRTGSIIGYHSSQTYTANNRGIHAIHRLEDVTVTSVDMMTDASKIISPPKLPAARIFRSIALHIFQ